MAPCQDQTAVEEFQTPPITPGTASGNRTIRGKRRWTVGIFLSARRSGAYFCFEVLFSSNSQRVCAHSSPLVRAFASSPYRQGECGSPTLSLYLWCRRWSATQLTTGPSIARLPAIASATRRPGLALNELCVKERW